MAENTLLMRALKALRLVMIAIGLAMLAAKLIWGTFSNDDLVTIMIIVFFTDIILLFLRKMAS